jgi:pimeloyl-ACP methyl ester carboxylesterase
MYLAMDCLPGLVACAKNWLAAVSGIWRRGIARAFAGLDSRVVETAVGPVEYALTGQGPGVLVIHGCPGGYDQGLIAAKLARSDEFTFISPSRPGYLRTPLRVGVTPEAQADSYAALLDRLGIAQVAIVGISGGAPSALQFALRHPERCWGLVTVCAIARRLSDREIDNCRSLLRRMRCTVDLVLQLGACLAGSLLKEAVCVLLRIFGTVDANRARDRRESLDLIWGLARSFGMISLRKVGLQNDVEQLTTMAPYALEKIKVPTLVMHGSADELVAFSHAKLLARSVPNARLVKVKGGGHMFFATHKEKVVPAVIQFLQRSTRALAGRQVAS